MQETIFEEILASNYIPQTALKLKRFTRITCASITSNDSQNQSNHAMEIITFHG